MAETTKFYIINGKHKKKSERKGYERWSVDNVVRDLVKQGGLEIDCLELKNDGFDSYLAVHMGSYRGNKFEMRWEHETFLLIALERDDTELVQAFAKVLGQPAFARYVFEGYEKPVTYEWESVNPDKRFKELKDDERKKELMRMDEK